MNAKLWSVIVRDMTESCTEFSSLHPKLFSETIFKQESGTDRLVISIFISCSKDTEAWEYKHNREADLTGSKWSCSSTDYANEELSIFWQLLPYWQAMTFKELLFCCQTMKFTANSRDTAHPCLRRCQPTGKTTALLPDNYKPWSLPEEVVHMLVVKSKNLSMLIMALCNRFTHPFPRWPA